MEHKDSKIEHDNFVSKSKGFFHYVFNLDQESKKDLYNISQYLVLAFIFLSILVNLLRHYFPLIDETHSSIEITIKMILYIVIIIYSIFYINRIICFIPTISGFQYSHCGTTAFIFPIMLSILISMISFNTQFNEGISILISRAQTMIGTNQSVDTKKKKKNVNSNEQQQQSTLETQQVAPTLYSGQTTPISQLPVIQMNSPPQNQQQQQQQQNQSYDDQPGYNEPVAANAGGSAFGGAFGDAW